MENTLTIKEAASIVDAAANENRLLFTNGAYACIMLSDSVLMTVDWASSTGITIDIEKHVDYIAQMKHGRHSVSANKRGYPMAAFVEAMEINV
jgi:hypothetical protein